MAAIVGATVEALGEVGYARTTTAEIARRAGVSQGGLFRHFGSRLEVVLAAAERIRARQVVGFTEGLGSLGEVDLEEVVRRLRRATRAPINSAWYELVLAARADAELRMVLAPMAARYHAEILELARALPIADRLPPLELDTIVMGIVHLLDGEALMASVLPHPEQEEPRIQQLVRILQGQPLY